MKLNQTAAPVMVIIEGVDRTGKDTLQQSLNKATDYKNMVMIRGPIGFLAYNKLYNKAVDANEYLTIERQLKQVNHLVVYLTADTDELLQRFIDTNEEPLREEKANANVSRRQTIEMHKKIHEIYYEYSTLNKMTIDTTNLTTEEAAEQVVKRINELYGRLTVTSTAGLSLSSIMTKEKITEKNFIVLLNNI